MALRRISGLPSNLHILYVAQDTADKIAVGVGSALEAVVASDKLRMYLLQVGCVLLLHVKFAVRHSNRRIPTGAKRA